jgi:uncharacterized membrane protein (DUF4010 family)
MNEELQNFYFLGVALAIGLLIGVERGWKEREAKEGERIAGIRTYGLIGLLGGGTALLTQSAGGLVIGLAYVAIAGALTTVYVVNLRRGDEDVGITSLITGLVTFMLGALAGVGEVVVAAAFGVVTTLLLSHKPTLHRWVGALKGREARAGIKLLLITVALLPVLPNKGYGPWKALNPYEIWWMVVLVAVISFVGYVAIKVGGARRGVIFTGLFGGLASSTALTLHLSRMARRDPLMAPVLATGILLACGTMFLRVLLVVTLVNPEMFKPLVIPMLVMALLTYLPAIGFWCSPVPHKANKRTKLKNPVELRAALGFGVLLALVMLLSVALQDWFGDAAVLVLAAASGIADVDPINLSLARMSLNDLALHIAATGGLIAAGVNSLAKAVMATAVGGREIGLRVGLPLVMSAGGGLATAWFWV